MYCKKCGTDTNNASFCPSCGAAADIPEYDAQVVGGNQNSQANAQNEYDTDYSKVKCPNCGGNHCQPMNETNVTGGGYNAGSGCCGYFLFGPLGLLCGACDSGAKSTSRTYWMCKDCGRRFNG